MSCSAPNCTNSGQKGFRVFRFPSDPERQKRWTINCRRDCWTPGPNSRICEVHFEENQFEANRADGWRKLKQNAVPTLFNVLNPPKPSATVRKPGIGLPKAHFCHDCDAEEISSSSHSSVNDQQRLQQIETEENLLLKKKIIELEKKSEAHDALRKNLSHFLSDEQINNLCKDPRAIAKWSPDSILKGLKLRFGLGKHGYNFIRSTGYPTPTYATLNNHVRGIDMSHGILHTILNLLKIKTENMTPLQRECCLLVDEMEISNTMDFDVSTMTFVGKTTLGEDTIGSHCMVVMVRGLQTPWKQVIAHEVTGPSTKGDDMRKLLFSVIEACKSVGLTIKAVVSDMASCNKSFWKSVGVDVSKINRKHNFELPGSSEPIYTLADVPHLLKNLKSATLKHDIYIPDSVKDSQDLPSNIVSSNYLKDLWNNEMKNESALRSLHHLKNEHLYPTHFNSMNVALAVQLFSVKTAAAIEKAVVLKQTHANALSFAWWVRLVNQWFEIMTSHNRKSCITKRNSTEKFSFLLEFVKIIQEVVIDKGWKPLNTGLIMSTLTVIELAKASFERGYDFFLPGRLTQDALENVFSQVRRRAGMKPSALSVQKAIKSICISQFISDIKQTNYMADSDYHLLSFSSYRRIGSSFSAKKTSPLKVKENLASSNENQNPGSSTSASLVESNDIYYIAGAAVNTVCTKYSICENCITYLTASDVSYTKDIESARILTDFTNMGGLKHPAVAVFKICETTENFFQMNKQKLLENQLPMGEEFIQEIMKECCEHSLPECCHIKKRIILAYLTTRGVAVKKHHEGKRKLCHYYSSKSMNKKACYEKKK